MIMANNKVNEALFVFFLFLNSSYLFLYRSNEKDGS